MRKFLQSYRITDKIVHVISRFNEHFECIVILGKNLSDRFSVETGVRQGSIFSPILFIITVDWIMREVTSDIPRGLHWTPRSSSSYCTAVFYTKPHANKNQNNKAKTIGLEISTKKTKLMCVNTGQHTPITINGEQIEEVKDFTYLSSIISSESGCQKDITTRLNKAQHGVYINHTHQSVALVLSRNCFIHCCFSNIIFGTILFHYTGQKAKMSMHICYHQTAATHTKTI